MMIIKYSYKIILLYIKGDSERCFKFFNAALFYDYTNLGITDEFNQARSFIVNNFHETISVEKILMTLSIIDVILKLIANDDEDVLDNIRDLRSNIINMIGFEKLVKEDVDKVMN